MAADREEDESSGLTTLMGTEFLLEELLRSLNLKGEDLGGVFVAKDEVETLKEDTKWMAVMWLLTSRPFSSMSLKKTMMYAWAPAQEVTFRELDDGSFMVKANCLRD